MLAAAAVLVLAALAAVPKGAHAACNLNEKLTTRNVPHITNKINKPDGIECQMEAEKAVYDSIKFDAYVVALSGSSAESKMRSISASYGGVTGTISQGDATVRQYGGTVRGKTRRQMDRAAGQVHRARHQRPGRLR